MRINFWLKSFLRVFSIAFIILVMSELIKGHGRDNALRFATLWSCISTSIFIGVRIYYTRKGKNCPFCDDLSKVMPPK